MNNLDLFEAIHGLNDNMVGDIELTVENHLKIGYAVTSMAAAAVISMAAVAAYKYNKSESDLKHSHSLEEMIVPNAANYTSEPSSAAYHSGANISTAPAVTSTIKVPTTTNEINETISSSNNNETSAYTDEKTSHVTTEASPQTKGGISVGIYLKPFEATINNDSDGYNPEECHHIDIITAFGTYRQLDYSEFLDYNIKSDLSIDDFGEYIGKVTETFDSDYHGNAAESQEPNLKNADVYYYAKLNGSHSVIIAKLNDQCSFFVCDENFYTGFDNGLKFYGADSVEDIEYISYEIYLPDDTGRMSSISNGCITDISSISSIINVFTQLVPIDYSQLSPHIGTPQWLNDAYAERKASSDPKVWESVDIEIHFKNGSIMKKIMYSPYLGNGYISGMEMLTPEQNNILKAIIK